MSLERGLQFELSSEEANGTLNVVMDSTSGEIEMEERRSTRDRQASVVRDQEGELNERKLALQKSRAGHIGHLTKVYNEIILLTKGGASREEVSRKCVKFDEGWRKFVDAHENYLELLDSHMDAFALERAEKTYQEVVERKLCLDSTVKSWYEKSGFDRVDRGSVVSAQTGKSQRSGISRASSRLSTVSKKREKLALAQLNLRQLRMRQELEEEQYAIKERQRMEEQECRKKRELLEAEMLTEQAAVSLKVFEEEEQRESLRDPFVKYLTPSRQTVLFSSSAEQAEPVVSVPAMPVISDNVEPVVSVPVMPVISDNVEPVVSVSAKAVVSSTSSTVSPTNPWTGNVPIVPRATSLNSQYNPPCLVSNQCYMPPIDPAISRIEPQRTTLSQQVKESWSSSWQTPIPVVPQDVKAQTANQQFDGGQEMVNALRQVVTSPKVEYHRFDGDPLKYVTFIHNFETYLEKDNPDESRRLQLLIQHCTGKAREAIESCTNLPTGGYQIAKQTLRENFGKPYVIAEAHIRKLLNLPCLKNVDGPSLLEFSRHLETAERALTGMGAEYVSELNHINTLREVAKKLPMFLRGRWTECAGKIIASDRRPKFKDLVTFVKERAKLVDNEFGRDMISGSLKEPPPRRNKMNLSGKSPGTSAFVTVCLGIIPVKVQSKDKTHTVETYALLDNGAEVTLCHELLANKLGIDGGKLSFTLTGMTGSTQVNSRLVDLVVMSMDESVAVELAGVKTVAQMPISRSCIPKKEDLTRWPHLQDIDIPSIREQEVLLLIGLKERPSLFLPLEFKAGHDDEPVAIRYSLGWTVIGPMAERKQEEHCSVNLIQVKPGTNLKECLSTENLPTREMKQTEVDFETGIKSARISEIVTPVGR